MQLKNINKMGHLSLVFLASALLQGFFCISYL